MPSMAVNQWSCWKSSLSHVLPVSLLQRRQMNPETVRRPPIDWGMMCSAVLLSKQMVASQVAQVVNSVPP
jgi:hypothetical protein